MFQKSRKIGTATQGIDVRMLLLFLEPNEILDDRDVFKKMLNS